MFCSFVSFRLFSNTRKSFTVQSFQNFTSLKIVINLKKKKRLTKNVLICGFQIMEIVDWHAAYFLSFTDIQMGGGDLGT